MSIWRRSGLVPGIYDEIVSERVRGQLAALPTSLRPETEALPARADVAAPVASLLREALDAALEEIGDAPEKTLALAEAMLVELRRHAPRLPYGGFQNPVGPSATARAVLLRTTVGSGKNRSLIACLGQPCGGAGEGLERDGARPGATPRDGGRVNGV